jgi:RNA polymerase sigma factor (sigma-70 family)
MKISNRQIVDELRTRKRRGYKHLTDHYHQKLLREAVSSYGLAHQDAEEVVNDALLAAVDGIHGFQFQKSDADFGSWMRAILRNRVRDHVKKRMPTRSLMVYFDEAMFEHETSAPGSEKEVIASIVRTYQDSLQVKDVDDRTNRTLDILVDVLETMEPWERVLLRCRAQKVSYAEISRYTGKNAKQLKVYHARVKKKLLELINERYPELLNGRAHRT